MLLVHLRDLPRLESMRDSHQGRPETPVHEGELSVHETTHQNIRRVTQAA